MHAPTTIVVFDVNETLSDLTPLGDRFVEVGAPRELSTLWFTTVLRDGIALAATGDAEQFAIIGRSVLRPMLAAESLSRPVPNAVDHILEGFTALSVHPDVPDGVVALHEAGYRLVTLSNGSAGVAEALLGGAGLRDRFEAVLSAQDAGLWKPARTAYEYAARACGTDATQMLLVAVHPWDLHGADSAGLRTAWINRTGGAYPHYFTPADLEVRGLDELARVLQHGPG